MSSSLAAAAAYLERRTIAARELDVGWHRWAEPPGAEQTELISGCICPLAWMLSTWLNRLHPLGFWWRLESLFLSGPGGVTSYASMLAL